jgi:GWxTD domain-containing protein
MNRISSFRNCSNWLCAALISAVLVSCKTTQKVTIDPKDLSYLYNPTKSSIKPRFTVLNQTDATSVLSAKFFTSDLFFSEANPQGVPIAQVMITVKLYNITNDRILTDTSSMNINIVKEASRREYIYKVPLAVEPGTRYMAEVKILDRLRLEVIQAFVPFNTFSDYNRYNFVARGHFNKGELFNPVVRVNEYLNLLYPRRPLDSLFISYYKPFTEVPYPPSMMLPEKIIDYDPDTTIALPYSDTLPIMFSQEGIYFCTVGRNLNEGYTFYNFGESFPSKTKPEAMIKPLAYLSSEDEINAMLSSSRPKAALDDFWIKCGGNVEKSRELIRIYYTRILYSNYYFTSFKEGWRTERGMIYTIYGPPDKVYKTSDGENWGYRKPVIKSSWGGRYHLKEDYLFFNFKIREDKFADNDFYLSRNETLVTYWDKAIASWRKGIVYRLDNPEDL